jgi:hypothetical protein
VSYATSDWLFDPCDRPVAASELSQGSIYAYPDFVHWLRDDLPKLEIGRLQATETPQEQIDYMMYRWIAGKRIIYNRMFKDLMPIQDEVWEMKTADIRVFGWMYRPCIFIAVFGDYADLYKGRSATASYEGAKRRVVRERDRLDLDEPKFTSGVFDDLICV